MRTEDKPLDLISLLGLAICFFIPFFWVFYIRLFGINHVFVTGRFGVLTPLGLAVTWSILGVCLFVIWYKASSNG